MEIMKSKKKTKKGKCKRLKPMFKLCKLKMQKRS